MVKVCSKAQKHRARFHVASDLTTGRTKKVFWAGCYHFPSAVKVIQRKESRNRVQGVKQRCFIKVAITLVFHFIVRIPPVGILVVFQLSHGTKSSPYRVT